MLTDRLQAGSLEAFEHLVTSSEKSRYMGTENGKLRESNLSLPGVEMRLRVCVQIAISFLSIQPRKNAHGKYPNGSSEMKPHKGRPILGRFN